MKNRLSVIVIIVLAFIIGFFVNNFMKSYFVAHRINDYHILSFVYGLAFAIIVDLTVIALCWKKISVKKNYMSFLLFSPIWGIINYDIFSFFGILIATVGIFILYKRKWFDAK